VKTLAGKAWSRCGWPSGLAAIDKVPVEGWLRWVALFGFYETVANEPNASEPGNYPAGGG
jgi:hypothetical protein